MRPLKSNEEILREAGRRLIFRTSRAHPDWTLLDLFEHVEARGPVGPVLRSVQVFEFALAVELWGELSDGGPNDESSAFLRPRLSQALRANGSEFDAIVLEVLVEAGGWVSTGYLRERVGGPRWKLQRSVQRLNEAGLAFRKGKNNGTRHRARLG